MRRKVSEAWLELGYAGPDLDEMNREAATARARDLADKQQRKAERDQAPVRRSDAKAAFARMHAVVDGAGEA